MNRLAIAALLLAIALPARAEDCAKIADSTSRLACYDKAAGKPEAPAEQPKAKPSAGGLTEGMKYFASRMNQAMLDAAINVQVFPMAKASTAGLIQGPFPSLILFGYISRVDVYQINKATHVVAAAKKLGYKSVDFSSKGSGRWLFDLTKPGQACAQDLCFDVSEAQ